MIQQIKWIDRKFEFNQPIGMFPMTLDRLRGTVLRLNNYTANQSKEALTKKADGKWSVQEHIGHLLDLEDIHEGRIDDFLAGKETLRAADMQNKKTTEANYNNADVKDIIGRFEKVRNAFIKRLEGLDETVLNRKALHPRLNMQMRPVDIALFVAEHDDQHLATIYSLLSR
jgi:hypothetical protein